MARVEFTAPIAEIVGKLAGSVFQYSYGGFQLHTKGKPRNPQTPYQQLRRGDFGFITASWRNLTDPQRQTFIDNAPAGLSGINFFTQCNINLALIEQPQIVEYITSTVPDDMPIEILDLSPTEYNIKASGAVTTVPTGTALLIFSTYQKLPTKLFTNPTEYSPIITFTAGTDLSSSTDILSAFHDRFGQVTADKYLCAKSALIDITNGNRTDNAPSCTTSEPMAAKYIPLAVFDTNVANNNTSGQTIYSYSMPGGTMISDTDRIKLQACYTATTSPALSGSNFAVNGGSIGTIGNNNGNECNMSAQLIRVSSNTLRVFTTWLFTNGNTLTLTGDIGSIDFTSAITIELQFSSISPAVVTAKSLTIDLIKAP
jgi:hypothetical protein